MIGVSVKFSTGSTQNHATVYPGNLVKRRGIFVTVQLVTVTESSSQEGREMFEPISTDLPKFDHLVEYNYENGSIIIYRVLRGGQRHLLTSLTPQEMQEAGSNNLPTILGEALLWDSPVGRQLSDSLD